MMLVRYSLWTAAAVALVLAIGQAKAAPIYDEAGGVVVGEGEIYSSRVGYPAPPSSPTDNWLVVPDEDPGAGPFIANARGGKYVQSLPDGSGGGGGPNLPPEIRYDMLIHTPGTYRLYVRWDGNSTSSGTAGASDSLFADVMQFKDGSGGSIADWYELTESVNGNFASPAWDGGGGFETNVAGSPNDPMTWDILNAGIYTLRFTQREDGSAVDAWVLQLESLAAPTGNGPAMSQLVPEPSTLAICSLGLACLAFFRRRRRGR